MSPMQVQMSRIVLLKKLLYLMNKCSYCCECANQHTHQQRMGWLQGTLVHCNFRTNITVTSSME